MSIKSEKKKITTEIEAFNPDMLSGSIDVVITRLIEFKQLYENHYESILIDLSEGSADNYSYYIKATGIRTESDFEFFQRTAKTEQEIRKYMLEKQQEFIAKQLKEMK